MRLAGGFLDGHNNCLFFPFSHSADGGVDFIDGLNLVCGSGDPALKDGVAIYSFYFTKDMTGASTLSFSKDQSDQQEQEVEEEEEEEDEGRGDGDSADSGEVRKERVFYNSDGDFLFVPQSGALQVITELGVFPRVEPGQILVGRQLPNFLLSLCLRRFAVIADRSFPVVLSSPSTIRMQHPAPGLAPATSSRYSAATLNCPVSDPSEPTDSPIRATFW